MEKMGKLIIARHHESEWNKLGHWTGWRDSHLTEYGFQKSSEMGECIKDIHIDQAFASMEVRPIETLSSMLERIGEYHISAEHSDALDERNYGDYTGKDKWEMEKLLGEEKFKDVRRGWDCPIPNGETLRLVYERAVPFFLKKIFPIVKEGKNVLLVAHGNSLRAITKYIENISDKNVEDLEIPFGAVILYDLDSKGHMLHKEVRQVASNVPA